MKTFFSNKEKLREFAASRTALQKNTNGYPLGHQDVRPDGNLDLWEKMKITGNGKNNGQI